MSEEWTTYKVTFNLDAYRQRLQDLSGGIAFDDVAFLLDELEAAHNRIAELERSLAELRAALIRWRDTDGTTAFPDADAALAELARGLAADDGGEG